MNNEEKIKKLESILKQYVNHGGFPEAEEEYSKYLKIKGLNNG